MPRHFVSLSPTKGGADTVELPDEETAKQVFHLVEAALATGGTGEVVAWEMDDAESGKESQG